MSTVKELHTCARHMYQEEETRGVEVSVHWLPDHQPSGSGTQRLAQHSQSREGHLVGRTFMGEATLSFVLLCFNFSCLSIDKIYNEISWTQDHIQIDNTHYPKRNLESVFGHRPYSKEPHQNSNSSLESVFGHRPYSNRPQHLKP